MRNNKHRFIFDGHTVHLTTDRSSCGTSIESFDVDPCHGKAHECEEGDACEDECQCKCWCVDDARFDRLISDDDWTGRLLNEAEDDAKDQRAEARYDSMASRMGW